jgi:hypothetical protein
MIGLGPHTMSTGDWVFVAALQVGLVALAVVAIWLAVRMTRSVR